MSIALLFIVFVLSACFIVLMFRLFEEKGLLISSLVMSFLALFFSVNYYFILSNTDISISLGAPLWVLLAYTFVLEVNHYGRKALGKLFVINAVSLILLAFLMIVGKVANVYTSGRGTITWSHYWMMAVSVAIILLLSLGLCMLLPFIKINETIKSVLILVVFGAISGFIFAGFACIANTDLREQWSIIGTTCAVMAISSACLFVPLGLEESLFPNIINKK